MSGYSQENASSLVQSVALVANGASWDPTTGSTNAITKNLFSAECYRIQKEDLHAFVKARLSGASNSSFTFTQPNIDYLKWGSVKEQPLSKFQKSSFPDFLHNTSS